MARAIRTDWEDKTTVNAEPAAEFGADITGEQSVVRELSDLFDEDVNETTEFDQTRVRNLPSNLLRAAGRIKPPEFKTMRPPPVEAPAPQSVFVADQPPAAELSSPSLIAMSSLPPPLPPLRISAGSRAGLPADLSAPFLPPLPVLLFAPERRHRPWIWIPAGLVAVAVLAVTTALLLVR
jgi:hypothetical protein